MTTKELIKQRPLKFRAWDNKEIKLLKDMGTEENSPFLLHHKGVKQKLIECKKIHTKKVQEMLAEDKRVKFILENSRLGGNCLVLDEFDLFTSGNKTLSGAIKQLIERMDVLYNVYVNCSEKELTEGAKKLRKELRKKWQK